MVTYNIPNHPHRPTSNSKVIGGAIIMILGIIVFFCAVFVPIMFDNIFLMFPFFFGGFIIIVIGAITLMIGIRNRYNQENPDARYNQEKNKVRTTRETICPYCGTSNDSTREFCISCDSKLKN